MRRSIILILLVLCGLAACLAENNTEEQSSRILPSRAAIMQKVYDPAYTVPDGFFADARAETPGSFTVHHVKNESNSFELCSDSLSDALLLEEMDAMNRSVQGYFIEALENGRYFEIVRELSYPDGSGNVGGSSAPGFARVFRCDYVDRSGVIRHERSGYAGRLKGDYATLAELQVLSEYLWQFTFFWPSEKKVLQTFSTTQAHDYSHTLVLALKANGADGECDLIQVVDWVFSLDRANARITKTFNPIFDFEAQLVDGSPVECG